MPETITFQSPYPDSELKWVEISGGAPTEGGQPFKCGARFSSPKSLGLRRGLRSQEHSPPFIAITTYNLGFALPRPRMEITQSNNRTQSAKSSVSGNSECTPSVTRLKNKGSKIFRGFL